MWIKTLIKNLRPTLLACRDNDSLSKVLALMVVSGAFSCGTSVGQLIASYAKIGDIQLARQVFDKSPKRGINAWNALIIAYSHMGSHVEVLNLYKNLMREGVRPDSSTFTVAIKACVELLDLETGEDIWLSAGDRGYGNDVFVQSSVLNLYMKCGQMEKAMMVFGKMAKRDIVCWTTMITGLVQSAKMLEAIELYRKMQKEGLDDDKVVMLGLIQACANVGDSKLGSSVHGYIIRKNIPIGVVVETSLVDMYAKNGNLASALCVFRKMPNRNVISWSALISGFAQNGFAENALELFIEMQTSGFTPDTVSLVSALLACSYVGYLKLGKSIHGYIVRRLGFNCISATAVIDMYAKCGALSCAQSLFDRISSRDLISWNAMIASYGVHGRGKEALSLFLKMIETNMKPDDVTFASLLSALSHSGLVEEGQYWFNLMERKFRIKPGEKHYTSIVDLLARAGRVEEAQKLIDSMESEPGITVWVALLSGCCSHRKFTIGEMAAKKVLELDPDEPGIYTLASNFYAAMRKWNEVAWIRRVIKESGKKVPGYSLVEVTGKLHAFVMEDRSHPQYDEISGMLKWLEDEMRAMGYVPEKEYVLHDLEEEVTMDAVQ
ncbi:Pentatricopeptide repeat [Dillenia turbinata]|uniref:Pentatricopeptide repeat n=1 Tax=Dillenia turbinata TaxID=194707 RepID=A0AAN8ZGS2_9MAGN